MWEEQEKMEEETETEWGRRSGREEGLRKAGGVLATLTLSYGMSYLTQCMPEVA